MLEGELLKRQVVVSSLGNLEDGGSLPTMGEFRTENTIASPQR